MDNNFYILLHVRKAGNPEPYGRFYIGNDRQAAYDLFEELQGYTDIADHHILCIELMETVNDLPVNIKVKSCSLQQLRDNTCLITKHVFRQQGKIVD